MTYFVIFLAVYLFSAALSWLYTHLALSSRGIWSGQNADVKDVIAVFMPVVNTCFLLLWIDQWPLENRNKNYNKLFNIKK